MKLYDRFYEEYKKENSWLGTFLGESKYYKYYTNSASKEHMDLMKNMYIKYFKKIPKKTNDVYMMAFKQFLEEALESYKYDTELIPIDQGSNYILDFAEDSSGSGSYYPLKTIKNYKDMIHRIGEFEIYCDTELENMKKGIEKKYMIPKLLCEKVIEQLEGLLKSKGYIPDNKIIPKSIKKEYLDCLDKKFKPIIEKHLEFIKKEYYPHCRDTLGYSHLPDGKNLYKFIAKSYVNCDDNIKKIHNLGLSEVKRIKKEMIDTKNKLGFKGSLKKFHKHLQDDKFFCKNKNEVMNEYTKIRTDIYKNIYPKYFYESEKPSHNYLLKEIPEISKEYSSAAYYYMPSYDLKRKGAFFLDPDSLRGHSKYTMKALSLHEGNPGHHYQLTYSIDKKIPKYMLFIDHSTCYIEGWGLYSENFTPKDDLYDWFGKLEYEMLRACRLVVDTGIHYYNWNFDKTYNYILKNTNMNEHEVRNETLRYIASPGQALAYKMGEIFFKNLRKKNEKMNIKEFHKRVLENGPLPCNLIEQKFNE